MASVVIIARTLSEPRIHPGFWNGPYSSGKGLTLLKVSVRVCEWLYPQGVSRVLTRTHILDHQEAVQLDLCGRR